MPRKPRTFQDNAVYHVINRAAGRSTIFQKAHDYLAFERILEEAHARIPLRLLTYVVMPNHFHLVLWPRKGQAAMLSEFMRWLQVTHVQRWHAHHHTSGTGPLYQGRFKAFPVQAGFTAFQHARNVCRYVDRNPFRAKLVTRADHWQHGGLWRRLHGTPEQKAILAPWPDGTYPGNSRWLDLIHTPQRPAEEAAIQAAIQRSRPLGDPEWVTQTIKRLDLQHTVRPRGRPKKQTE